MKQRLDSHTYRIEQMEHVVAGVGPDTRARNNLYRQAMVEGADYEGLAEIALTEHSSLCEAYAALATMKYAKAAALKAR